MNWLATLTSNSCSIHWQKFDLIIAVFSGILAFITKNKEQMPSLSKEDLQCLLLGGGGGKAAVNKPHHYTRVTPRPDGGRKTSHGALVIKMVGRKV